MDQNHKNQMPPYYPESLKFSENEPPQPQPQQAPNFMDGILNMLGKNSNSNLDILKSLLAKNLFTGQSKSNFMSEALNMMLNQGKKSSEQKNSAKPTTFEEY